MASLNKIQIIGNVGADPEVRCLENGQKVASFRVATSERYKGRDGETKEETTWHSVNAWNKSADFVEKFITKGAQVYVEGRLKSRTYQKKDGTEAVAVEIAADNVQILGRKGEDAPRAQSPAPAPAAAPKSQAAPVAAADDDDLPF